MEAEEESHISFLAQCCSTPGPEEISECEVRICAVIAANTETFTRYYSMDCFQSTTCNIEQETGTAVQESAVQEVATQETTLSSADETCAEQEETEEHE